MQGRKKKIMNFSTISKSHFVFSRVHVHVDQGRINLKIEHKGRMTTMVQHVTIGLLNGVGDQLIANDSTIDEKVLKIRLRTRKGRQAHPAAQTKATAFRVNVHDLINK